MRCAGPAPRWMLVAGGADNGTAFIATGGVWSRFPTEGTGDGTLAGCDAPCDGAPVDPLPFTLVFPVLIGSAPFAERRRRKMFENPPTPVGMLAAALDMP